jgi:hypothetical protein
MRNTIQLIAEKLNAINEPWLLSGRTAAILQGAALHSNELLLFGSQQAGQKMSELFSGNILHKTKYREDEHLAGYSGNFRIDDIAVTMIGDPQLIFNHRKYNIPIDDIYLENDPFEIGLQQIPLMPAPWILLIGVAAEDELLIKAMMDCGVPADKLLKIAEILGMSYYFKPRLSQLYHLK